MKMDSDEGSGNSIICLEGPLISNFAANLGLIKFVFNEHVNEQVDTHTFIAPTTANLIVSVPR